MMENDSLKAAWKKMATEEKSSQDLQNILRERSRSLARGIRRQLITETIAAAVFLVVYYDFFDGDQKPFFANVLLVTAWTFVIIHNLLGYFQQKPGTSGENMAQLLSGSLSKMKVYAVTAGVLRILAAASLLFFFIAVISFTQVKYWILAGMIFIFLIQMALFFKIWSSRIRRLKQIVKSIHGA